MIGFTYPLNSRAHFPYMPFDTLSIATQCTAVQAGKVKALPGSRTLLSEISCTLSAAGRNLSAVRVCDLSCCLPVMDLDYYKS
jgi:hypothetical protein